MAFSTHYGLKTHWVGKTAAQLDERRVKPINDAAYARFLERLKAARKQAGISQELLASRLQKHQTFVSKVENGERLLDLVEYLRWAREIDADALKLLQPLADGLQGRRRPRKRTPLKGEDLN